MGFITHIPGTNPVVIPERDPRSLGLGVLGLHEGRTLLLALDRVSSVHAVAGCDVSAEKVEACRSEKPDLFYTPDYREMLAMEDVRIVAIYTPDPMHADHVVAAFEAGKDVICTKPLVNSLRDARRVLEAGRRTGRRLMVGQSTRFFEPFVRQRRAYERGDLGEVELLEAHYIHRMDWYYEKSPWAATGTDWVFLGLSHPIDLLCWYLGPIARVHAFGARSQLGGRYQVAGPDVYIVNAMAESGRIGRVMGHYGCRELPSARNGIELVLYGTTSTSQAQYHDMRYRYTAPDGTEITEDHLYAGRHYYFNSEVHGMHYGEFANYAEAFARAILDGNPNSPDLEEGIRTFCVMDAVGRSAREGRVVEVEDLTRG
ncbi:MAG: Gfo/Idh/MocA family oxidoreductase [Phycisphaeraceae bacterium]|nr:Gfo/Idh/MocA family oxidoreductase [Phycisphaerae bacterium]MBX3391806.1 Gfo/Idh/MocA family oxidoreductase [Phycisphaeraceae bacterium]